MSEIPPPPPPIGSDPDTGAGAAAAPPRKPPKPRAPRKPKVPPPPVRTDMRPVAWVALAILMLDQILKYWVVHILQLDRLREIDVLPPWLNLRMAWNQGVNFGLFASQQGTMRLVLIGVALAICIWVWVWIWRSNAGRLAQLSAGLLIGGAIGNVIDRLLYGAVADFLNMSLPGWQNPYSFNVADISIFAGAIGLVLMPQGRREAATQPARRGPTRHAAGSTAKPQGKTRRAATGDKPRDGAGKSR